MFTAFLAQLEGSCTIVTANQRLSSHLIQLYDQEQQIRGLQAWPSLDCLPLTAWIQRQITDKQHLILSDFQTVLLWQQIIHRFLDNHPSISLISNWSTAETAAAAGELLAYWQIPVSSIANFPSEDVQTFYRWSLEFKNTLEQQQLITIPQTFNSLIQQLQRQQTAGTENIVFAGFEEIPPLLENLRQVLRQYCQIHDYQHPINPTKIHQLPLANQQEELTLMATWAKQQLSLNPGIQIGCVIPQLASIRNQVERSFKDIFTDQNYPLNDNLSQLPFNISIGKPLTDYPLIAAVFSILEMNLPRLAIHNINTLLGSPFIAGAEQELISRGRFAAKIRELGQYYYHLSTLQILAKKSQLCPVLEKCLEKFAATITSNHNSQPFTRWATLFKEQLQCWGWPGERSLSSDEYQQWQRWQKLLDEFSSLEILGIPPITYKEAVDYLFLLAKRSIFQSKTTSKPIQILGSLEAIGQHFDYSWIMSLNDHNWPAAANPNPFLPLALQQQAKMPHSSAEKELHYSQRVFSRLMTSANEILFSYSQQEKDISLFPSPLLKDIPLIDLSSLALTSLPTSDFLSLEKIHDATAPQISVTERIRGGAGVLKNQAACPFSALAINRLGAKKREGLTNGFSAIIRGNLVHQILEKIWQQLQSHEQLCRYQDHELEEIIIGHIKNAFNQPDISLIAIKPYFRLIEQQRLAQLIKRWLLLEKQRPPFTVVAQEKTLAVQLADLTLTLRIDREDELENGDRIIIDYKTGKPDISSWFEHRPNDPQLPLYSLINDQPISGLVFAQIRSDELLFKGLSANSCDIAGVKTISEQKINPEITNWPDFQHYQKTILTQLATDFSAGHAIVDPKEPATCEHCGLQAFCRKHEQTI